MQAGGGNAGACKVLSQIKREHDLRKLALAVRLCSVVAALEHHVVEIDRRLARRADVHDAGGGRADEEWLE